MTHAGRRQFHRAPAAGLAVAGLLALTGAAQTVAAAPPDATPTAGEARVNGKPLAVAHAYLFHAPDQFNEKEINAVVLLTSNPVDEAALKKAATLGEALSLAKERVVVEAQSKGRAGLSICHPQLEGLCYSTTVGSEEWTPSAAATGHLAGRVRMFGGTEQTVFQKYKLYYEFTFDAAPVRDFAKRR